MANYTISLLSRKVVKLFKIYAQHIGEHVNSCHYATAQLPVFVKTADVMYCFDCCSAGINNATPNALQSRSYKMLAMFVIHQIDKVLGSLSESINENEILSPLIFETAVYLAYSSKLTCQSASLTINLILSDLRFMIVSMKSLGKFLGYPLADLTHNYFGVIICVRNFLPLSDNTLLCFAIQNHVMVVIKVRTVSQFLYVLFD